MKTMNFSALLCAFLAAAACNRSDSKGAGNASPNDSLVAREARLEQALARPDTGGEVARWVLPPDLNEISGLALTADGRLLTHNDQQGKVWEIDHRRGVLVKSFQVGKPTVKGDFEGITIANGVIFLIDSKGDLYEFREGANGAQVDYKLHDTKLGSECEFEGVAFDPSINSLLLACKNVKGNNDSLVIYRWKLQGGDGERLSQLTVPLARVIGSNGWKELRPSDITVDPTNGNYVLIASQQEALIVITPAGEPVSARPLPGKHVQAEGVAITKDGILIVSDEAGANRAAAGQEPAAVISLYRWP
jgi:uncharacterized protein YjiK